MEPVKQIQDLYRKLGLSKARLAESSWKGTPPTTEDAIRSMSVSEFFSLRSHLESFLPGISKSSLEILALASEVEETEVDSVKESSADSSAEVFFLKLPEGSTSIKGVFLFISQEDISISYSSSDESVSAVLQELKQEIPDCDITPLVLKPICKVKDPTLYMDMLDEVVEASASLSISSSDLPPEDIELINSLAPHKETLRSLLKSSVSLASGTHLFKMKSSFVLASNTGETVTLSREQFENLLSDNAKDLTREELDVEGHGLATQVSYAGIPLWIESLPETYAWSSSILKSKARNSLL